MDDSLDYSKVATTEDLLCDRDWAEVLFTEAIRAYPLARRVYVGWRYPGTSRVYPLDTLRCVVNGVWYVGRIVEEATYGSVYSVERVI